MSVNEKNYKAILEKTAAAHATLVAVSKTKPASDIQMLYDLGQRAFGENYVQELVEKEAVLPKDIHWHFIGHLQSNKVKYIAPFVHLIHGVDSFKLLTEIDKQAAKHHRIINCLLQVHIAKETTKFGFDKEEVFELMNTIGKYRQLQALQHINICGLMGMASFTDDTALVQREFEYLSRLFIRLQTENPCFRILSMGMSGDYELALEQGSTMVRVGSLLFGARA
ncbi:YggS family pyridoxal phosphate enzyme [Niabella ginsenosidivorans]|uniref:Pyridoxal phosphate homeostasis protein n=1 Tax=Niabella ginsenosidivorans TaxID=1176587 RepID=A0A1A9I1P0_9BACT|nr:YggS family pyridoxal phosphate-dependent enzyme [Niabella ginsenosidivorans]ANH81568.1 YggS family pyridoxal phosphate enzyme [Niabella ginsenosidivorans]